jgi:hypothetical protein
MTMEYEIKRVGPEPKPRRIDYERMQKVWPKQKAALTRAIKTGSPVKVAEVCIATVKVWDEIGCWPDDWAHFQRGLNDMPGCLWLTLEDVAYGRVVITEKKEED